MACFSRFDEAGVEFLLSQASPDLGVTIQEACALTGQDDDVGAISSRQDEANPAGEPLTDEVSKILFGLGSVSLVGEIDEVPDVDHSKPADFRHRLEFGFPQLETAIPRPATLAGARPRIVSNRPSS